VSARGDSPHLDWVNLVPEELKKVDFPVYVVEQKVGDLVVFPPATAHQVWNMGTITTKLVWNTLHPLSLEVGFNYVQPPFNRLCSPDVARTSLSLACAMLSLVRGDPHNLGVLPPDLPLLSRLFREMVEDESIGGPPPVPQIKLVQLPETVIATCDFCGTAIWNRHVRCTECKDFDLCLSCYLAGRSCEHASSYSWAEIVPEQMCIQALSRAREILGFQAEETTSSPNRPKNLGTAVNELMQMKQSSSTRLCHLCRIDHPDWKGRRCDKCSAFFCFRGLYRHFDVNSSDVIRHGGLWTCPKCTETCNCRVSIDLTFRATGNAPAYTFLLVLPLRLCIRQGGKASEQEESQTSGSSWKGHGLH
jgi:Zinc finger, ZZ type/Zinc-finger domain of monoamine-oxidase A repressor R1/JmjC domain, hydroxylase